MKKLFIVALVLTSFAATANIPGPVSNINSAILTSFKTEFRNAVNVEWTVKKEFVLAKFTSDNQPMFAYFKPNGELMAVTRNINRAQLPMGLNTILKQKYTGYHLVDLFEVMKDGESVYYATMRNSKCSVTLQSLSSDSWHVYKKQKV